MHPSPRNRGANVKRAIITMRDGTLGTLVLKVNVSDTLMRLLSTHVPVVSMTRLGNTRLIITNLVNAVGQLLHFVRVVNVKVGALGKEGHPQLMMKPLRRKPKTSTGRTLRRVMRISSHPLLREDLNPVML